MWVRAAVVIQQYNTIRELSYFVLYVLLFIKYVLVLIISEPCLASCCPAVCGLVVRFGGDYYYHYYNILRV